MFRYKGNTFFLAHGLHPGTPGTWDTLSSDCFGVGKNRLSLVCGSEVVRFVCIVRPFGHGGVRRMAACLAWRGSGCTAARTQVASGQEGARYLAGGEKGSERRSSCHLRTYLQAEGIKAGIGRLGKAVFAARWEELGRS